MALTTGKSLLYGESFPKEDESSDSDRERSEKRQNRRVG